MAKTGVRRLNRLSTGADARVGGHDDRGPMAEVGDPCGKGPADVRQTASFCEGDGFTSEVDDVHAGSQNRLPANNRAVLTRNVHAFRLSVPPSPSSLSPDDAAPQPSIDVWRPRPDPADRIPSVALPASNHHGWEGSASPGESPRIHGESPRIHGETSVRLRTRVKSRELGAPLSRTSLVKPPHPTLDACRSR